MKIKIYSLNSIIKFGKFKGMTLDAILNVEPDYIKWCILHLDHFCILEEILNILPEKNSTFVSDDNFIEINKVKTIEYKNQCKFDNTEKPSFGKYNGTYAQDYEGLSDDFIDDALDGFADAYWNID